MESTQQSKPQFSQPVGQIITMVIVLALVSFASYLALPAVSETFLANPFLNGFIVLVFLVGIGACFWQVLSLMWSVQWIEGFATQRIGHEMIKPPRLLAPLANLLRQRGVRSYLPSSSTQSILESVATRLDELREITRYISSLLIFLGLLGTFYGLATTVPGLVETIKSLNMAPGEDMDTVLGRLQNGLETQLGGMGVAFASSLLGLAGSLVVGLLELFAGHGQNRFYRELEEWLSSITRVGYAASEGENTSEGTVVAAMMEQVAEQMDSVRLAIEKSSGSAGPMSEKFDQLAVSLSAVAEKIDKGQGEALARIAQSQEQLLEKVGPNAAEGVDAESRMRLRSIDTQLQRVVEEMSAGRQESIGELRNDLANLSKTMRHFARLTQEAAKGN